MMDFEQSHTKSIEVGPYLLKCYDPYGFWKISHKEGAGVVPKELDGDFTSSVEAERAINSLANKKSNAPSKVKKIGQGHAE